MVEFKIEIYKEILISNATRENAIVISRNKIIGNNKKEFAVILADFFFVHKIQIKIL